MISTSCKLCIHKDMHGNVQTGCKMRILENIDETKISVRKKFEDGIYHSIIEDRICMYLTDKKDGFVEPFIKFTLIIKANTNITDLEKTLESVSAFETLKDFNVIIVSKNMPIQDYFSLAKRHIPNNRLKCVSIISEEYDKFLEDEAFKSAKNGWILFLESGQKYDSDMLMAINHSICNKLMLFCAVSNPEGYQCLSYKFLGGNSGKPITEKLTENKETIYEVGGLIEDYRTDRTKKYFY